MSVVDIPGEYLSADMDDEAHMVFRRTLAEMMVMADQALYRTFVSYETGKPVLYARLQKEIYGCIKSTLFFYEKLVGDLEAYGFKINPYDPCVSNKMIGRKQLTVYWHVDDLKISYIYANEVTKIIQLLESEYGEMHGSRGKRHNYLGMWLGYSIPGEVCISMEENLRGILNDFPEEITETPETPAASNLFNIRNDKERELLDEARSQAFHHAVAQLLFTGI